jgi:hypothetical protein
MKGTLNITYRDIGVIDTLEGTARINPIET